MQIPEMNCSVVLSEDGMDLVAPNGIADTVRIYILSLSIRSKDQRSIICYHYNKNARIPDTRRCGG